MEKIIHRASSRGHAQHGWLDSWHSFSFADYYDPTRMHFGTLRVLNDDTVAPGRGFGTHPHDNMEIVTIPLSGVLEHRDNTGRHGLIKSGDVQIMSAGTGITHSEINGSRTEPVHLLQIWVLPKELNIVPRYDQRSFDPSGRVNTWQIAVSPRSEDKALQINQEAWFALASLEKGKSLTWTPRQANSGIYLFVMDGKVTASGESLGPGDALGIHGSGEDLVIQGLEQAQLLLMDLAWA